MRKLVGICRSKIHRFKALGRVAILLLVLNEIRGIVVVAAVVSAWRH
jgi:hypothetical protein